MLAYKFEELAEQKVEEQKEFNVSAQVIQKKLDAIEERFAIGEIGADIYEKFSSRFRTELKEIEKQNQTQALAGSNLEKYLDFSLKISTNLCKPWELGDFTTRQKQLEIIYPDSLHFSFRNGAFRTERINSVLSLISSLSDTCYGKKGIYK